MRQKQSCPSESRELLPPLLSCHVYTYFVYTTSYCFFRQTFQLRFLTGCILVELISVVCWPVVYLLFVTYKT